MIIIQPIGEDKNRMTVIQAACDLLKELGGGEQRLIIILFKEDAFYIKFKNNIDRMMGIKNIKYNVVEIKNPTYSIIGELKRLKLRNVCNELFYRIHRWYWLEYMRTKKNTYYQFIWIDKKATQYVKNGKDLYIYSDREFYVSNQVKNTKLEKYIVLRRCEGYGCGMFSYLLYFMPILMEIDNLEMKFAIDMKNYRNVYLSEIGGDNAWEYFYEQPCGIHLEDVLSEEFIFSDFLRKPKKNNINYKKLFNGSKKEILKWNQIYSKYIRLKPKLKNKIDEEERKIRQKIRNKKILGVKFRCTDYVPEKIPDGHYFQATTKEMIEYTKKYMRDYSYDYIFLAVEEEEALHQFQSELGDKVLNFDCKLISNYQDGTAALIASEIVGKRQAGEDYIITISLLSKCDALLTSINSGSIMSVIINGGKYDNIFCVDKGIAHK